MKRELTNQELLDRYVHSVKTLLPPDKMDDIAAEISSNLQSLVEDRATELGRELRPEELSAILKQHGHPMVVASRYRDQRGPRLIGPELFPIYWNSLRAIFTFWLVVRVITVVFALQGTAPVGSILKYLARDIVYAGFFIGAVVTMVFAAWEYLEFKFRYSEKWKPESLPPVPPPVRQPRLKQPRAAVQIVGGVVFLIFFGMALFSPWMFWVWGGRGVFSPSAALYAMRLLWWLLALFGVSESWLNFTRFAASEWRPFLRIAVSLVGIALAIFLVRRGDLLVAGPNWNPAQAKSLATMNQGLAGFLVLACIVSVLGCLRELRRSRRATARPLGGDGQTAHFIS
jgi:hypothetical protein